MGRLDRSCSSPAAFDSLQKVEIGMCDKPKLLGSESAYIVTTIKMVTKPARSAISTILIEAL